MLDKVTPNYVNRAHNEYLELLIETGVPGIAVLAVFVSAIGARLILALRKKRPFGIFGLPAGLAILLVGLHSIVDYPLRTQSLAVLFGVILALFFSERKAKPPVSTTNRANHA
jgi:O-antigen ligase